MRKVILVPALICGMAAIGGAQTKITGKLTCSKPSVSEMAGVSPQMIEFSKANCNWTSPFSIDGSKPGRTVNVGVGDINGSMAKDHGYSTSIMDNGDTTIVRYEGTTQVKKDRSGTIKGTWKYVHGSGKFSGISGGGTYKGEIAADGSGWADVSGHYSLGKGKAKKST